jgi:hypothetical protein
VFLMATSQAADAAAEFDDGSTYVPFELPEMEQPRNIHEAIVAVRKGVPFMQRKDSKGLNYKIVKVEELVAACRVLLDRYRINHYPSGVTVASTDGYPTKSGGSMQRVLAAFSFTWAFTDQAGVVSQITTQVLGEAADNGDKSGIKAETAGWKQDLLKTLNVVIGDEDPDKYASKQLGANKQLMELVTAGLKGAKKVESLEILWARAQAREFDEVQIEQLHQLYVGRLMELRGMGANGQSGLPAKVPANSAPAVPSAPQLPAPGAARPSRVPASATSGNGVAPAGGGVAGR